MNLFTGIVYIITVHYISSMANLTLSHFSCHIVKMTFITDDSLTNSTHLKKAFRASFFCDPYKLYVFFNYIKKDKTLLCASMFYRSVLILFDHSIEWKRIPV